MRGMEQVEPGVFQNPRNPMEVYTTVAYRVRKFREERPDWRVDFEILNYGRLPELEQGQADYRPRYILMRCEIRDFEGKIRSVGHAEEDRKHGPVNRTNAIENAETSALGRALANLGYCTGNYASADEVEIAKGREESMNEQDRRDRQRKKPQQFKPNPDAEAAELSMSEEHTEDIGDDPHVAGRNGGDASTESPYSKEFTNLLAEAQVIASPDDLKAVWGKVQKVRDELSETELDHLKPIILAARSRFHGGGK